MLPAPRTAPALPTAPVSRLRSMLPSLLVAAVALGYVALDLWGDEIPSTVPGEVPPLVHAGLVLVQALALLAHRRRPLTVFGVVVAADLVVLATTAGQLGIGALGVILATYMVAVRTGGARRLLTVLGGAVATTVVGSTSMVYEPGASAAFVLSTTAARVVVLYVLPAVAAAYARDRERLRDALDAQERLAERQRQEDAERQVRHERAALARELHDIAGHHLSGIIVGAQAATALLTSDPERARTMLRTVQDDARITLGDLRQTVGLLRDDDGPDQPGQPSRVPTLAGIEHLAEAARERGQEVRLVVEGDPRTLGPLAEATAYRTVQESLTNAARHAPGAACHVTLAWTEGSASVTVHNAPARVAPPPSGTVRPGHGLAGMAERAELVGARLTTGPARDGGWTNQLVLATDGRGAS